MKRAYAYMLVALVGCTHVKSGVRVDAKAFEPRSCTSGQARGFAGVELADQHQQRLRLAQGLDEVLQVIYFAPGAAVGTNLGPCGTMTFQNGLAVVNGVRNVEGTATLNCNDGHHTVVGSVAFEGCH